MSRADLKTALGPDLAVIDELTDAEAAELLELYAAAREDAMTDLVDALDESLQLVPRLLRAPVKAILFPKGAR